MDVVGQLHSLTGLHTGKEPPREKRHLLPVLGIDLRSFSSEARGICCAYTGLADRVSFKVEGINYLKKGAR